MLKKYLADIAFMQILNLLIKPIWILVIDRAVQNTLSLEVYVNYAALFNFSLMFFIILDLGLNGYNTTQVSRDTNKIVALTGNILGLKMILIAIYVLFVFVVGAALGYGSAEFLLLIFLCILQIFTSLNQYLRTIVASLQQFKWDGIFMVLDRVLVVILCAILLWGGLEGWSLTIERFIFAQLAGVFLVSFVLVLFLRKYFRDVRISFDLKTIRPLLQNSWPFALLITLMGLYNYVDSVMLKTMVGNSDAGIYAHGYRLFYAILMFAQIFSGVLLPFFSKNIKDKVTINLIASFTAKFLLLVAISVALLSAAYSNQVMDLMYHEKATAQSASAFSFLMLGFIGSVLILVYGTLLTAALELKYLNMAAFITLCINLALNTQLIPLYGPTGAAIATAISQLLFGTICYAISFQEFGFQPKFINIIRQAFGIGMLFLVILMGKQYCSSVAVHLSMIFISILISAYMFKLFQVKDLKSLT